MRKTPVMIAFTALILLFAVGITLVNYQLSQPSSSIPRAYTQPETALFDISEVSTQEASPQAEVSIASHSPLAVFLAGINGRQVTSCRVAGPEVNGTLYVYGSSVRITGTIAKNDLYDEMTDILSAGGSVYMWNKITKVGYVFPQIAHSSLINVSEVKEQEALQSLTYLGIDSATCSEASSDTSLFTKPTTVSFSPFHEKIAEAIAGKITKTVESGYRAFFSR